MTKPLIIRILRTLAVGLVLTAGFLGHSAMAGVPGAGPSKGASNLSAVRRSAKEIALSWQAPMGIARVHEYHVLVSLDQKTWNWVKSVPGSTHSVHLLDMPGSDIYLKLRTALSKPAAANSYAARRLESEMPVTDIVLCPGTLNSTSSSVPLPRSLIPGFGEPSEASPKKGPVDIAVTYQAEDALLKGPVVKGQLVDFVHSRLDYIEWTVSIPAEGRYNLGFVYSMKDGNRPLELKIDGEAMPAPLQFPSTGDWHSLRTRSYHASLAQGTHRVRLTAIGASGPNFDALTVTPIRLCEIYEAEEAAVTGAKVMADQVDFLKASGSTIEWSVRIARSGRYDIGYLYSLGTAQRRMSISVDGVAQGVIEFPGTGRWSSQDMQYKRNLALDAGQHVIKLATIGWDGPNIDHMLIQAAGPGDLVQRTNP